MNSSIEQLRDALELLVFNSGSTSNEMSLQEASKAAKQISNSFVNVNSSLVDGWATASDFFERIQSGVGDLCYDLYNEMNNYVEETKYLESQAQAAVEKANETAKSILDDLNLNGDLHFFDKVENVKYY